MVDPESPAPEPAPPAGVADGVEHPLDPAAIQAWRVTGAVAAAIVIGVTLVSALVQVALADALPRALLALAVAALVSGAAAALAFYWPVLRYRHTRYRVDDREMWIRRGVIWRSEVTVPRSRVQHTDVSQGPIERNFGLASLVMHTAGTHHASIALGGLRRERAERIRDHLIHADRADGA